MYMFVDKYIYYGSPYKKVLYFTAMPIFMKKNDMYSHQYLALYLTYIYKSPFHSECLIIVACGFRGSIDCVALINEEHFVSGADDKYVAKLCVSYSLTLFSYNE